MSHRPRGHVTKKLSMSATDRLLLLFAAHGSPLEGELLVALGPKSGPVTPPLPLSLVPVTCNYRTSSIYTLPNAPSAQTAPLSNFKNNHLCFTIITYISSCRIMTADNITNKFSYCGSEKWKLNTINYKGG